MSPRQSASDCVVKLNCRSVVHNSSVSKSVWLFSHRPDITTLGVKHQFTYCLAPPPPPPPPPPNNRVPTNFSIQESRDKEQTAPFGRFTSKICMSCFVLLNKGFLFLNHSSGAGWKSRWPSWAPVLNKPTVSVDVKQHSTNEFKKQ